MSIHRVYSLYTTHKSLIYSLLFLVVYSTTVVLAAPPTTPYYPTDNITDPTCSPTDTNCYVSVFPDQTSNTGKLLFTDGTNPTWASNLYWDETNDRLGIGTSSPQSALHVDGDIIADNILDRGIEWTSRTSAADTGWTGVTYGNGMFVAVSTTGAGTHAMTSPDGINWTIRASAADLAWRGVTYGNGLFVAVNNNGTSNGVMTSPDGITWTSRTSPTGNWWFSVTYGDGLFVAVASTGTGNRVMTSPDGINWTSRTSAVDNTWRSVTYGNGMFVAVSVDGTGNRVMTSPDGINWTSRTSATDNAWRNVTYGNGMFVAVASTGTGNRVMTSPDGITWTSRTSATDNDWYSVTYGNGMFVAVAATGTGNRVMTSPDGITWTSRTSAADIEWLSATYGNGMFVAVAATGTGNRVMTSGKQDYISNSHNNIYQGGLFSMGSLGVGTSAPSVPLHIIGSSSGGDTVWIEAPTGTPGVELYMTNNNANMATNAIAGFLQFGGYINDTYSPGSQEFARIAGIYTGTGTERTGDLTFQTGNNGAPAERVRITSSGSVGIGAAIPAATLDINGDTIISGASRYLNFSTTSGTSGYGFRDNAGVMEYKNSGGSWTGFSSGSSPFSIVNTSNIFSTGLSGTGSGVTTTTHSTFIGVNAGSGATSASNSNFFGQNAGLNASVASTANFIGLNAGSGATGAINSNFFGQNAGLNASSASTSNFMGVNAGSGATSANNSNFFGQDAGENATGATNSNFFGRNSGLSASSATYSNFFGFGAGSTATSATQSNFFGRSSGSGATNASNSNFIGYQAGNAATGASNSNFVGYQAGYQASNAQYSNISGYDAGYQASNASYSNIFGYNAGKMFTANNIGSNNIIIGTNISLPDTTANAINLGGVLFGTGTYATTTGNPSITPVSGGKIGIGVVAPSYTLQVGNSSIAGIVARFENSTGTCDINPTNTALICSSDATLKKNINTIDSSLSLLTKLRPVTYNWNTQDDTTTPTPGFIAQEVESIFPFLVTTDATTNLKSLNYTLFTPYIIKSIQELDIKVQDLTNISTDTPETLGSLIKLFIENTSTVFERVFARELRTEKICVDDTTCLNTDDIRALIDVAQERRGQSSGGSVPPSESTEESEESAPAEEPEVTQPSSTESTGEVVSDSAEGSEVATPTSVEDFSVVTGEAVASEEIVEEIVQNNPEEQTEDTTPTDDTIITTGETE